MALAADRLAVAPVPDVGIIQDLFVWSKYTVRVGPGLLVSPSYQGSSHYKLRALPVVDLKFKQVIWLRDKSLWVNLHPSRGLKFGPILSYSSGRYASDDINLQGLKDVHEGMEVGGYVASVIGPFAINIDLQKEVIGGHGGWIGHLEAGTLLYRRDRLSLTAGLRMSFADQHYMNAFFGINSSESAATGLATFHTKGGIKDIGLGLVADYSISKNWSVGSIVGCSRLLGIAASSPLVRERGTANQCIGFVRLVYQL